MYLDAYHHSLLALLDAKNIFSVDYQPNWRKSTWFCGTYSERQTIIFVNLIINVRIYGHPNIALVSKIITEWSFLFIYLLDTR